MPVAQIAHNAVSAQVFGWDVAPDDKRFLIETTHSANACGLQTSNNWTYQAATQFRLSLIASVSGGGVAAKTRDQNGNDTVIRFSSTGAATVDPWTGANVDYFIGSEWTGIMSGGSLSAYSATPVKLSSSVWFEPSDGGSSKAVQTLNVTNFSTTGANQTTTLNVYQKILAALPSYSTCKIGRRARESTRA